MGFARAYTWAPTLLPNPRSALADSGAVDPGLAVPTGVVVVAEVRLYREGLAASLAGRPGLRVLGAVSNRDEALAISSAARPDVIVIDMSMRDALQLVRAIRNQDPRIRVVTFAVEESEGDIVACAEAGVAGYVSSDASVEDLVATIASCTRGELICSPRVAATLFQRVCSLANDGRRDAGGSPLTGREQQIVALIERGFSNKEIAQRLNIEVPTVKNHVHNLLEKLKVTTRAEAAAWLRGQDPRRSFRRASATPTA